MRTDEKQSLVDPELMVILRCPRCRGELGAAAAALTCKACQLAFAVSGGVPNFLLEDAQPLTGGQEQG